MERVPCSTLVALALAGALAAPMTAQAHCDTLDGPVAARKALDSDINLVLVWVRKTDEDAVVASRKYDPADVEAGRAHSRAYVEFVHYAERLYDAGEILAPEAVPQPSPTHTH